MEDRERPDVLLHPWDPPAGTYAGFDLPVRQAGRFGRVSRRVGRSPPRRGHPAHWDRHHAGNGSDIDKLLYGYDPPSPAGYGGADYNSNRTYRQDVLAGTSNKVNEIYNETPGAAITEKEEKRKRGYAAFLLDFWGDSRRLGAMPRTRPGETGGICCYELNLAAGLRP